MQKYFHNLFIIFAPFYVNSSCRNRFKCCNLHDHIYIFLDNGVMTTPKRWILTFVFTVLCPPSMLLKKTSKITPRFQSLCMCTCHTHPKEGIKSFKAKYEAKPSMGGVCIFSRTTNIIHAAVISSCCFLKRYLKKISWQS